MNRIQGVEISQGSHLWVKFWRENGYEQYRTPSYPSFKRVLRAMNAHTTINVYADGYSFYLMGVPNVKEAD